MFIEFDNPNLIRPDQPTKSVVDTLLATNDDFNKNILYVVGFKSSVEQYVSKLFGIADQPQLKKIAKVIVPCVISFDELQEPFVLTVNNIELPFIPCYSSADTKITANTWIDTIGPATGMQLGAQQHQHKQLTCSLD